jgi:ABC-type glutathione transport system ATPase component
MLPILLPYNESGAIEIISMIGESGSAKEVIMAAQEAAERLERSFEVDLEEPEVDDDGDRRLKRHSRCEQMIILVELYTKGKPSLIALCDALFL